jgi:hypothetical protein
MKFDDLTLEEMERFSQVPPEEAAGVFFAMQLLTWLLDDQAPDAFAVNTQIKEYADELRAMFAELEKEPELGARLAEMVGRRDQAEFAAFVDELRARRGS